MISQVPYIVAGELVCIVGLSLLTRLSTDMSTLDWASALVVTGFGLGMAMQLPYTAVQVTLTEEDVPIGNGMCSILRRQVIYDTELASSYRCFRLAARRRNRHSHRPNHRHQHSS